MCAASTPWSSAAATPSASRWRCCCCRPTPPSPSATAPRRTWRVHTRQADIVVAAVGRRNMLRADMVKPGAVVIDVGMNRNDDGKLCGDVDFDGGAPGGRLDHAGARRRRADDHHHAAGQHPRGRRACRWPEPAERLARRSRSLPTRCCRRWACRPSTASRPAHVAPAVDALLADADAALERGRRRRRCRPTTTRCRAAAGRADRTPRPRLGRGDAPERGGRHARAARGLPRRAAAHHRFLHPAGRRRGAVRQVPRRSPAPADGAERRRSARRCSTRCATSCSAAPSCRARHASASRRSRSAPPSCSSATGENVLDATDRFAYLRQRGRDGRRAAGRAAWPRASTPRRRAQGRATS